MRGIFRSAKTGQQNKQQSQDLKKINPTLPTQQNSIAEGRNHQYQRQEYKIQQSQLLKAGQLSNSSVKGIGGSYNHCIRNGVRPPNFQGIFQIKSNSQPREEPKEKSRSKLVFKFEDEESQISKCNTLKVEDLRASQKCMKIPNESKDQDQTSSNEISTESSSFANEVNVSSPKQQKLNEQSSVSHVVQGNFLKQLLNIIQTPVTALAPLIPPANQGKADPFNMHASKVAAPPCVRETPTNEEVEKEDLNSRKSGFINTQNTCYMNSVLQCLINSPQFFDFFLKAHKHLSNTAFQFSKICEFLNRDIYYKYPFSTDMLKESICRRDKTYSGSDQQDAHEFLRSFLDILHNDLNESSEKIPIDNSISILNSNLRGYSKKSNRDIVFDLFGGIISNSVECCHCKSLTSGQDNFLDLSLSIPQEIQQKSRSMTNRSFWNHNKPSNLLLTSLLKGFFKQKQKIKNYFCENCQQIGDSDETIQLSRLPQILVLHLKRFCQGYNYYGQPIISKIDSRVQFQSTGLDMKQFLKPEKQVLQQNEDSIYDLYGIIHHQGSIHSGHYTATCKNPVDHTWNIFDDAYCERNINIAEIEISSSPYIFFYKKRSLK